MNSIYNYLDKLNDQQRAAVEYCGGPSLVIAGAGSGKTRVLTYKVLHLIRIGIEPWRILALTFTNKAAREIKERIDEVAGPGTSARLWAGTFHSVFLRILRNHAADLGYKSGFTIYDSADSRSLIKSIVKEYGLDEKQYKAATVANIISNAKNALMTPEQYANECADSDRKSRRPMISAIFDRYVKRCKAANAMDFDDILLNTNILLRDHADIRLRYQEMFRYILVDEYQDTNFAQHMAIRQLVGPDKKLCVVGDDAQSIYSFRGANISNIIDLEKAYPGLRTFRLERNYRSTRNIVDAAGSLIERNTRQIPKKVYSENEQGEPVEIVRTYSDIDEANIVASKINFSKLTEHDSYEDYAVLYRTNAQSRVLEESLRKRNIAYRIVGGTAFYQRKEIKDMTGYFRIAVNPDDDEALRRVINFPARGIGEKTVKKIQAAATEANVSMWEIIDNPETYKLPVNSGTRKKLDTFADMVHEFIADNMKSDAYSLGQLIFNRTGVLLLYAHDNTPESISRQENLSELLAGLKEFVDAKIESEGEDARIDMATFLSEISLATDADQKDTTDEPKVTLMTVHAAKGLEFKHVYIVGAEEELFPSQMAMDSIASIEEERRLMYVAITRAKKTCMITYTQTRFRNGQTKISSPSRFLSELNPKFLYISDSGQELNRQCEQVLKVYSNTNSRSLRSVKSLNSSSDAPQHKADELSVGMKIEHSKLGIGTITKTGNISGEPSITVDFGVSGVKNLLLRFAKFNIL